MKKRVLSCWCGINVICDVQLLENNQLQYCNSNSSHWATSFHPSLIIFQHQQSFECFIPDLAILSKQQEWSCFTFYPKYSLWMIIHLYCPYLLNRPIIRLLLSHSRVGVLEYWWGKKLVGPCSFSFQCIDGSLVHNAGVHYHLMYGVTPGYVCYNTGNQCITQIVSEKKCFRLKT